MTIRIGIIGCGRVARPHLKAYNAHGVTVTAVADITVNAANELAREAGGAASFSDYRALLESRLVDAVSICTPPTAHEQPAVDALNHGIHVLCEKPLAHDLPSARRIAVAAEKSTALFMPAFPFRFQSVAQKMRDTVREGKLGQLVFFHNILCGPVLWVKDTWYARKAVAGGGVLLDICSHSVDLFRFIVGEVIEQHAVSHRHLEGTDVEDAGIIVLKAENGAVGTVSASWVAGVGQHFINIIGQRGRLYYDYANAGQLELTAKGGSQKEIIPVEPTDGFTQEVGHFLAAVRGETRLSCTIRDALRTVEIIAPLYAVDRKE